MSSRAAFFDSGSDGGFRVVDGAQSVQGEPVQQGDVAWGVVLPGAVEVFAEGDIEHPVQLVLDAPVGAGDLQGLVGVQAARKGVEARMDGSIADRGDARDGA